MDVALRTTGHVPRRICDMRSKLEKSEGLLARLKRDLKGYWDDCAGYQVLGVDKTGDEFVIKRISKTNENPKQFTIDVTMKRCECGEWQDKGYPCIDAIAYFRLHKKYNLSYVLKEYVESYY